VRSLFTVHAGEFLVGSEIERHIRHAAVWVPSKDTGIDLLVTSSRTYRPVSLQVKFSRDYSSSEPGFVAFGWWTLDRQALLESKADLWVFVLLPFEARRGLDKKKIQYVIAPPKQVAARLRRIHGAVNRVHVYLGVTRRRKCWEGRGLKADEKMLIAVGQDSQFDGARDFSSYLNAWPLLTEKLRHRR
jgi:hypothetical protein